MCEGADRNPMNARCRDLRKILERDPSRRLEESAVLEPFGDLAQLLRAAVVKQLEVGTRVDRGERLLERLDLDLYAKVWRGDGAGGFHGLGDTPRRRELIVQEQESNSNAPTVREAPTHNAGLKVNNTTTG